MLTLCFLFVSIYWGAIKSTELALSNGEITSDMLGDFKHELDMTGMNIVNEIYSLKDRVKRNTEPDNER